MEWSYLGVLVLGLCCTLPVVRGQGYDNVARGKSNIDTSGTYSGLPSQGNDGNNDTSLCWSTNSRSNSYWQVDLGRAYPVYNITIYLSGNLYPFTITVDGHHCVTIISNNRIVTKVSVTCSSVVYGQRVNITGTGYLQLCEFQIWVCAPGFYGLTDCIHPCHSTRCLNNICNPQTGKCMECRGDFIGETCSECNTGYYMDGDACRPCSISCEKSRCDRTNGECNSCLDGRHGTSCNETCTPAACQRCDQLNGQCTACKPFHNLTSNCKDCQNRFYNNNTDVCSPCGTSCKNCNCDGVTGECMGCVDGRYGEMCNKNCSALCKTRDCAQYTGNCTEGCVDGHYGATCSGKCKPAGCQTCERNLGECKACKPLYNLNVSSKCKECEDGFYRKPHNAAPCTPCSGRCYNNATCNKTTGACDRCPTGWGGNRCFNPLTSDVNGRESGHLTEPVVGAIIGVGLLLTVSVVLLLCWKQRSQNTAQKTDAATASTSAPISAHNNMYDVPPAAGSPLSAEAQEDTQHEIRDPGNPYEKLRVYSNMVFDRHAYSDPEPRGTDVTTTQTTSEYVNVTLEHIYANMSSAPKTKKKPPKKKAK